MKDNSIYVKCYFRIEAGYKWGKGMDDNLLKEFNKELADIFKPLGFKIKEPEYSNRSIEVWRGAENLYCHPMDLVGEIKKENIKAIETTIKKAKTFSFRCVDTYDEMFNYTTDEFILELAKNKEAIENNILEIFKTKRSNLYKSISPLWDYKTNIKFFRDDLNLKNMERDYINSIFETLRIGGQIKESQNKEMKIYRTINKKDKVNKEQWQAENKSN
jgi:hypothetical protein